LATCFDLLIYLTIVLLCVGSLTPGINESHYLPKAKHTWDPTFAAGNDLFLDSHDSHFLTTLIAGALAKYFELATVAWIGRVICWILFAIAWHRLTAALEVPRLLRAIALAIWILLVQYCNLAGEWFVGGFEAKSFAYPLAIIGLAQIVRDRWTSGWLWLGASVAFHPVVGGWIGISCFVLYCLLPTPVKRVPQNLAGWLGGFALGMIGVWPALSGLGGQDVVDGLSAAKIHVHLRLAHHLNPRGFTLYRVLSASACLGLCSWATWLWLKHQQPFQPNRSGMLVRLREIVLDRPLGKLVLITWLSVLIALVGWGIDTLGVLTGREVLAARLLRFYWFRWSDVAIPLITSLLLATTVTRLSFAGDGRSLKHLTAVGNRWIGAALMLTVVFVGAHWYHEQQQQVSPADRLMMDHPGPAMSDQLTDPATKLPQRMVDWLAVCDWIKHNSPANSLWFTPQQQQTFKWYAGRAEVISWKDVPQNSSAILEWYRRIERCAPRRRATDGRVRAWKTEELIELARVYRFNWVLVDRSFQDVPPLLELKYPINIENRSFAVFYISEAVIAKADQAQAAKKQQATLP
jgi:hypothetical protein